MSEPLTGQLLVAGRHLRDPNFYKTVVLMVEHGDEGAMGLVVNRPSTVTVAHALSQHFEIPETDDLVFVGGPVEPTALFVAHSSREHDNGKGELADGVYVASDRDAFESVVCSAASGNAPHRFRIFCGCAGWAPGQLEGEIARGDWHLLPASAAMTFHDDPYKVWDLARKNLGEHQGLLPRSFTDPECN